MSETKAEAHDPDELAGFKAFAIERSRDPAEGLSARHRALMACIVIPAEIQKWMLDAGAVEPLLDSIEKTILAAENAPTSAAAERVRVLEGAAAGMAEFISRQLSKFDQIEGEGASPFWCAGYKQALESAERIRAALATATPEEPVAETKETKL